MPETRLVGACLRASPFSSTRVCHHSAMISFFLPFHPHLNWCNYSNTKLIMFKNQC
ncbi:hypothetical protein HanLR1_Chr16g0610771 [Helianthus annuus]|nr:hypothetical protein HanLR1_Chr16g0610771 [Helianthus annuus]